MNELQDLGMPHEWMYKSKIKDVHMDKWDNLDQHKAAGEWRKRF